MVHLITDDGRDTVNIGISKKGAFSVTGGHIFDQNRLKYWPKMSGAYDISGKVTPV